MPALPIASNQIFFTTQPGPKGAPPLFLIHGAGGNHLVWPPALRRFPDAPVYSVDLPGHGRSQPPGFSTINEYADAAAALIEKLPIGQVVAVGHSMGGAVALTMALRHPDKTAGIVLIGTGARLPVSDLILNQALTDYPAAVDFITRYAWSRNAPTALVEDGRQTLLDTRPEVTYGDFLACNRFNVMDRLPQIRVPALVIAGAVDKMTPPEYGRFLAEHIPQAELVLLEEAGHMMMLEQPGPVAAAVAVFMRRNFT